MKQMIGKNYFGNYIQNSISHNTVLNNLMKALILSGQSGTKVFDLGLGERLIITQPIFVRNAPRYFMALVTPTSSIYSDIDNILSLQRAETLTLFIGLSIAIIILIIIYIKWNTILRKEVEKNTNELDVSNKQLKRLNKHLSSANKQLEINAKTQSEFINLAAHELKTPAQSILGYTELLMMEEEVNNSSIKNNSKDRDNILTVRYASAANRNALRLQRLIKDILDVARIESNALRLIKERFHLVESINHIISDIVNTQVISNTRTKNNNNNTRIVFNKQVTTLFVFADRVRIDEVISNLIIMQLT
jgi:signal transduction histidine kinase